MRKEVLAIGCALMMLCGCGNNSAAQHYESGWAALEKKDYSTAEQEFQQVIDLDSRLAESYRAEGIAYYSEGAYPEAIAAFSRSLNNMDERYFPDWDLTPLLPRNTCRISAIPRRWAG